MQQNVNISLLLFLCLWHSNTVFGQSYNHQIDSLKSLLFQSNSTKEQVDLLNQISYSFRRTSPDSIMKYARMGIKAAKKVDYLKGLGVGYKNIGIAKYKLNEHPDTTIHYYKLGLKYATQVNDFYTQAACFNNIGLIYTYSDHYYYAIEYFHSGLKVFDENLEGNEFLRALMLGNLGINYGKIKDTVRFEKYLGDAILFAREYDLKPILAQYLGHYGLLIYQIQSQEEGLKLIEESSQNMESLGDYESKIHTNLQLAKLLLKERKINEAENLVNEIIAFSDEKKYYLFNGYAYHLLSGVAYHKGEFEKAVTLGERAYQLLNDRFSQPYYLDLVHNLSKAYEAVGDYEKALFMSKAYIGLADSLRDETIALNAAEVESKYAFQQQEQEIRFLNKEKEMKDNRLWWSYAAIILGVAAFVVISLLYFRVNRLNQTIKNKNQELQKYIEANMQLENFAFIASHDLKSPLRNIVGFAQLLKRSAAEKLNGQEKEYLDFVTNGTKELSALIEDLLMYSRIERATLKRSDVQLRPLINKVVANALNKKDNTPKIEVDLQAESVCADPIKLQQLLQNLIENAIKFSSKKAYPQVDISTITKEDGWVFSIKDNGIGIDPSYFEKIFLIFKRLHTKDVYTGSGIGLAICKKVVDQHQGRIWVESEPGQGSTFSFFLPRKLNI